MSSSLIFRMKCIKKEGKSSENFKGVTDEEKLLNDEEKLLPDEEKLLTDEGKL